MQPNDDDRMTVSSSIYDVNSSDPQGLLVDRSGMDPADVVQIGQLMASLGRLKDAEQELSDASLRYMKLNQSDMRALHYLIVSSNQGVVATPGAIAAHLNITTASTTKLLDRLERAGHILRSPHPSDRRALAITITATSHEAAMSTVGRQQSKRFHAAARLSELERAVVIRFLDDMAEEISVRNVAWAQAGAIAH